MTQTMRRRMLIAGTLAAAGMAGSAGSARSQTMPAGKPQLALVLKSLPDPFTLAMVHAAQNYQAHYAAQFGLIIRGTSTETDTAAQIRMVNEQIKAKVNAIVLAPTDSKALIPVVEKAIRAGIIMVTIDNPLDDAAQDAAHISVPFVGPNNRRGAMQVGSYLAGKLLAGAQVGIVEGSTADRNAQQRTGGFTDAMNAAGMKIVAIRSGEWEYAAGRDAVSKMLADFPQLRALLCGNDNMAMGAVDAVRDAGRTGGIVITGYNDIEAIKPLIADGRVLATMNQFAERQAVFGMDIAVKAVTEGHKQADLSRVIETPLQLVTAASR
ncbi:MAG TPA: substrate-binding domain-containing protein [Paraburkholderia sp.]|jgi:ribose transport system substrate-binding protein|nr:substrate-binding domain-containing protein [Paraburkholderia sp.]